MKVVDRPVTSIEPYEKNPRNISDTAVAKVAASIQEFGFRQPIVVDENNVILVGHTRLQAAKSLGLKKVPVHVAAGLTAAQAKAYRLADNRTNQEAEWNNYLLLSEFDFLDHSKFDLALAGFDDDEVAQLRFDPSTFGAGSEDEQGKLDELAPKIVMCPKCGEQFDSRGNE